MSEPNSIMAYHTPNRGEQEWRYRSADKNQIDVMIHIRGSPSQLQELFQGSPGGYYGTPRSIGGNNCSLCEPDYSRSSVCDSNEGVHLQKLERESREPTIRRTHQKQSSGGCCIIFSPLVKLVECLTVVLTCCF
ncbi:uncharacterized protein LOC126786614 isoform X2 [Argentina anserina]|uniref:uncharacterized protein LOC126786614 isoform X2 n=1 Tax=Argentina anserina TaxID=57926 RepID=UPI00217629A9|nr:uncharacterized protein LOC126786614 isoform X2 [Potentilla anserina]